MSVRLTTVFLISCLSYQSVVLAGGQPLPGLEMAREIQAAIRGVAQEQAPAIVAIRARRRAPATDASGSAATDALVAVNGAGVIVRSNGLILTNEHVIQNATEIFVTLNNGRRFQAEVHAADHRGDMAILRIPAENLPTIAICDWNQTAQGDWVVAVGNPLGVAGDGHLSISVGVIANFNRRLPGLGADDDRLYHDLMQFTAVIHPGHSGGPLLNLNGQLVGIVTAMHVRAADDAPLSFALPLTPQRVETINRLCRGDPINYGYIGMVVTEKPAGGASDAAVVVSTLDKQGPAQRAGLSAGDQVLNCNGRPISAPSQFAAIVGQTAVGMKLELDVIHAGSRKRVSIPVEQRQSPRVAELRAGEPFVAGNRMP